MNKKLLDNFVHVKTNYQAVFEAYDFIQFLANYREDIYLIKFSFRMIGEYWLVLIS